MASRGISISSSFCIQVHVIIIITTGIYLMSPVVVKAAVNVSIGKISECRISCMFLSTVV